MSAEHRPELEYAVLISLTWHAQDHPEMFADVYGKLNLDVFYYEKARQFFRLMDYAVRSGLPVHAETLFDVARDVPLPLDEELKGLLFEEAVYVPENIGAMAERLIELADRRNLRRLAVDLADETGMSVDQLVENCEARLRTFKRAELQRPRNMAEIIRAALDSPVECRAFLPIIGVGMEPGTLNVVAGATAMGKTTYALLTALRNAQAGLTVKYASLEMAAPEMAVRMSVMNGSADALQRIELVDSLSPRLADVIRECKRWALTGADLLIVDHLQCLSSGNERFNARRELIGEAAVRFKQLAREINQPVVLVSQLSRAPAGRNTHRPLINDLKESGEIENYADRVIFLFRDSYYTGSEDPSTEIICAKNRFGKTGYKRALWDFEVGSFTEL